MTQKSLDYHIRHQQEALRKGLGLTRQEWEEFDRLSKLPFAEFKEKAEEWINERRKRLTGGS